MLWGVQGGVYRLAVTDIVFLDLCVCVSVCLCTAFCILHVLSFGGVRHDLCICVPHSAYYMYCLLGGYVMTCVSVYRILHTTCTAFGEYVMTEIIVCLCAVVTIYRVSVIDV